ncbi:BTAD domain-containing putative transcriptional regulator [Kutzneria sp. NPDC051319]|uniref:BTAD domain-containing putative transcriptional regulator n=1 Tax=Kutzneria sp. NPDC051319 TaxID=3155047 RepID=UPI00342F9665
MASEALTIEVLGPLHTWRGDVEIKLGPARQRALFTALVFRNGGSMSREELIEAVWGDEAPATADGSVYTYISGLRRALEPARSSRGVSAVLPSDGTGYRVLVEADAVDATRFESLSHEAANALADGDAAAAAGLAEDALAMWRGEPLSGLPGPFVVACRRRLTVVRSMLLETRSTALLQLGRHAELVPELTALVGQDPLHEGLRGLLMIALYRCGRQADALDQYQQARTMLAEEFGAQPAPELSRVHQQILADDPTLAGPSASAAVVPRPARPSPRAHGLVGRESEVAQLTAAVAGLVAGHGRAVWIDGEPGIGKSELIAAGLGALDSAPVEVCWASGDELALRFPLRAMLECLAVDTDSPDPRRAHAAELIEKSATSPTLLGGASSALVAIDILVDLVHELCAERPVAVVVDDMQWVDEASMLVWNRLARATDRLPLLLVSTCRPMPRSVALDSMRETVDKHGGAMMRLGRLSEQAVYQLMEGIVGAAPGPGLRRMASRAGGNPLYVQELVDALVRDNAVQVSAGTADAGTSTEAVTPVSLVSALEHRLGFLSSGAMTLLQHAALLGTEFRAEDLAAVLMCPVGELDPAVEESIAAGVLFRGGDRLAFRHPLVHQVLYERIAHSVRAAMHRQAAEQLDRAGASVDAVARQLAAAPLSVDDWTIGWVCSHGRKVAVQAPDIGVDLLRRVVSGAAPSDPRVQGVTADLARVSYWLGESPEDEARSVLMSTADRELAGEMQWILGCALYRRGLAREGVEALRAAVHGTEASDVWRARCQALLAGRLGMGLGELDAGEATAWEAVRRAEVIGDTFARSYALEMLWLFRTIQRDHVEGLRLVDEALRVIEQGPQTDAELSHLELSLLDNRVFSLQNLDRLPEADETLLAAEQLMRRDRLPTGLPVATAVNHYWAGRWGSAMETLDAVVDARGLDMAFHGLRESGPMLLLLHGVAALIAVLRDEGDAATAHLAAADELPLLTSADRENCDFLIMAEALAAERDGETDAALIALTHVLDERYAPMMLRHQWLPDAVRIALQAGKLDIARRALEVCEMEAKRETVPARATIAVARCHALINRDPAAALAAAEHYFEVGRPVEAALALEDAAVLLASAGLREDALDVHARAMRQFDVLGAAWGSRRATARLIAAGVSPG